MTPLPAWPSFREPWAAQLDALEIDAAPRPDLLDSDHRRVRLDLAGTWSTTSFTISTSSDEVFTGSVASVQALVSSPRTNTRVAVPLVRQEKAAWRGEVRLPARLLGGTVRMWVEVAGTHAGRTRLVGRSDEWVLSVDPAEAPTPPGAPPFTMTWLDFSGDDAPALARRNPDAPFVMDMTGTPVLLLNERIEGFRDVLHADHAKGEKRRARDVLAAQVAQHALASVLRAAVAEMVTDTDIDGDVAVPTDRLKRQALGAVAGAMEGVADISDLAARIVEAERGPMVERLELWAEIDAGVARLAGVPAAVLDLSKGVRFA